MRHTRALVAFSLFLIAGCEEKGPGNINVIIESAGKHPVNGQYVSFLEVKGNDAGKLRLWFGSANKPIVSSTVMDLHEGWFVYGESQTRFWVFDGDATLKMLEYSGSPGDERQTNRVYAPDEIPKKILPRLGNRGNVLLSPRSEHPGHSCLHI